MTLNLPPMQQILNDPLYAWELLNTEVAVELSTVAASDHIAKLLTLYMLGVQKCNSVLDPRQIYFKTKVNMLMSKQNVIKGLTQQVQIKPKKKEHRGKQSNTKKQNQEKKVYHHKQVTPTKSSSEILMINPILFEKRKELEMRLAFEGADQNSPETLQKTMSEFEHKQTKIKSLISQAFQKQQTSLEQRRKKRKEKAMTVTQVSKQEQKNISLQRLEKIKQFEENICEQAQLEQNLNIENYKVVPKNVINKLEKVISRSRSLDSRQKQLKKQLKLYFSLDHKRSISQIDRIDKHERCGTTFEKLVSAIQIIY